MELRVSVRGVIDVLVNVPYLIADLLLVLLPVTGTAAAEEDDGDDDEEQEDSNNGPCDDACSVGGWVTRKERVYVCLMSLG